MTGYILDTNIYIGAWRDPQKNEELAEFVSRHHVAMYQHTTVAFELLAGTHTPEGYDTIFDAWVRPFDRRDHLLAPHRNTLLNAARILRELTRTGARKPPYAASFLDDCVLAASSREFGVTVVTDNIQDFRCIATVCKGIHFASRWP